MCTEVIVKQTKWLPLVVSIVLVFGLCVHYLNRNNSAKLTEYSLYWNTSSSLKGD